MLVFFCRELDWNIMEGSKKRNRSHIAEVIIISKMCVYQFKYNNIKLQEIYIAKTRFPVSSDIVSNDPHCVDRRARKRLQVIGFLCVANMDFYVLLKIKSLLQYFNSGSKFDGSLYFIH